LKKLNESRSLSLIPKLSEIDLITKNIKYIAEKTIIKEKINLNPKYNTASSFKKLYK